MPHALPALPYDYTALEPHIDEQTMRIHHDKHHAAYVNNLNAALEGHADLQALSIEALIGNLSAVPEAARGTGPEQRRRPLQPHPVLGADGPGRRQGAGRQAGRRDQRGLRQRSTRFKEQFAKAGMGRFGSGWAWLVKAADGKLSIESSPNQDSPVMDGKFPVLGLRRLGARLLPQVPEPPRRLPRGLVERGQLDGGRRAATTAASEHGRCPRSDHRRPTSRCPRPRDSDVTLSRSAGQEGPARLLSPGVHRDLHRRARARSPNDYDQFADAGAVVLPISVDSVPTLKEFKAKEKASGRPAERLQARGVAEVRHAARGQVPRATGPTS